MDVLNTSDDISFRTNTNTLAVNTSIITRAGSRNCGKKLPKNTALDTTCSVFFNSSATSSATSSSNSSSENTTSNNARSMKCLTCQELYNL